MPQAMAFREHADHLARLFGNVLATCRSLSTRELLTYLHSTVSDHPHPVDLPSTPADLNWQLCDTAWVGGWNAKLGSQYVRICSIISFPARSIAPALERLDHLPFEYRRCTRWIAWNKQTARGLFRRTEHGWVSQEKSPLAAVLQRAGGEIRVIDSHATNQARDADAARQEISGDYVGYGHFTTTVVVWDEHPQGAEAKLRTVTEIFEDEGFTVAKETVHTSAAFRSSLPGDIRSSVRRKPLNTMSVAHLAAGMKSAWPGPDKDAHLKAEPWFCAMTEGSTLFHVVNHVYGVGHTLVLGPTGAGKTSLLDFGSVQWARYWPVHVFRFAVGGGERAMTLAVDGQYYPLGTAGLGFQPYRNLDDADERRWAHEWTLDRLKESHIRLTDTVRTFVGEGLSRLAQEPLSQRTITQLVYVLTQMMRTIEGYRNPKMPHYHAMKDILVQQRHVVRALDEYTAHQVYGHLLDADHDDLGEGWYHTFEQESLLTVPRLAPAVLSCLFHRLEARLTGIPTLIEMDEATLPMVIPDYEKTLPAWAMTKRKQNVSLVISMPIVTLLEHQALRPLLLQSCPTRIFTANPAAMEPDVAAVYRGMGCNETVIQQMARARPAGEYVYMSPLGCRRFQLDLGGSLSAVCGSTNAPEDRALIDDLLAKHGRERFAVEWFRAKGYPEAAQWLEEHGGSHDPSP